MKLELSPEAVCIMAAAIAIAIFSPLLFYLAYREHLFKQGVLDKLDNIRRIVSINILQEEEIDTLPANWESIIMDANEKKDFDAEWANRVRKNDSDF